MIYGNRTNRSCKEGFGCVEKSGDTKVLKRIRQLLASIIETPFDGIGKPEPLKYQMGGLWSRRITQKDRIVYEIKDEIIFVYSLKGHYEKG